MRHINYRALVSAESELLVILEKLKLFQAEAEEIVNRINNIASQERKELNGLEDPAQWKNRLSQGHLKKVRELKDIMEQLSLEYIALRKASECLCKANTIYKKAENNVLEIYSGEYQIMPRTKFGTSHFEKLNEFDGLISVSTEARSDDSVLSGTNSRKFFSVNPDSGTSEFYRSIADDFLL